MRKINNKYLGTFYIEELENREEQDRVKLYDSDEKYLEYLPIERYDDTDPTEEEQYQGYIEMLEIFKTVPDLMEWLVSSWEFIGDKDQTIKYLHEELNWDLPSEDYNPLDNEWVNRIGDVYIVVSEY